MTYRVLLVAEGKRFGLSSAVMYVNIAGENGRSGMREIHRGDHQMEFTVSRPLERGSLPFLFDIFVLIIPEREQRTEQKETQKRRKKQYEIQEKATLHKPKLETRKELQKNKEGKTKENTENKEPKQTEQNNLHYLKQD